MPKSDDLENEEPANQRHYGYSDSDYTGNKQKRFDHSNYDCGLPELTHEYLASLSLEELHHKLNGANRRRLSISRISERAKKDLRLIKAEFKRRGVDNKISVPSAPPPPRNPSK